MDTLDPNRLFLVSKLFWAVLVKTLETKEEEKLTCKYHSYLLLARFSQRLRLATKALENWQLISRRVYLYVYYCIPMYITVVLVIDNT